MYEVCTKKFVLATEADKKMAKFEMMAKDEQLLI